MDSFRKTQSPRCDQRRRPVNDVYMSHKRYSSNRSTFLRSFQKTIQISQDRFRLHHQAYMALGRNDGQL